MKRFAFRSNWVGGATRPDRNPTGSYSELSREERVDQSTQTVPKHVQVAQYSIDYESDSSSDKFFYDPGFLNCLHLIQKRLSSELLHCALHNNYCCIPRPQSTMDVTNLYIVACQDRKAFFSTLLPWLIHECRCIIVGTCSAI